MEKRTHYGRTSAACGAESTVEQSITITPHRPFVDCDACIATLPRVPSPFCGSPDRCAGLGSCPRDRACDD